MTETRAFDPIPGEFDLTLDEVTGVLPPDLTGTLYRNGAGRWDTGGTALDCLFDPDGMVSAFVLDGRRVRFRNRYVRTRRYLDAERTGRVTARGVGFRRPGGAVANALRRPANTANTSVLVHGDRLLALWEAGRPHVLDADTLATLGTTGLGGALRGPFGAYSAHYCEDPATGTVVNFGYDPYLPRLDVQRLRAASDRRDLARLLREQLAEFRPRPRLRLYETDRRGVTRYLRAVPLPALCFVHDMALTARYAVVAATPLRFDPAPIVAGTATVADAMHFVRGVPARILLVPRDGGPIRTVETDPFFAFHFGNAFDDGDDVVLDLPRFPPEAFHPTMAFFTGIRSAPPTAAPLTRLRISARGRVTAEPLGDAACEFPRFDPRRAARPHTLTYGMVLASGGAAGTGLGIARFDHAAQRTDVFTSPDDDLIEPVFVPRSPGAPEHDGWVLTVGYDRERHRSRLMIFDAAHLPDGPVAEAWLPFHVPITFHGTFTPRVAA